MVIHLTGPDTFRSFRRLQQLRQAFRDKFDPNGFNTVTLDGQSATNEEVRTAIQTTGFFSKQRFVAIDDYVASSATCPPPALVEAIAPALQSKEIVIVIRELAGEAKAKKAAPRKKTKTTAVKKQTLTVPEAKAEEFPLLNPLQLAQWATQEAKARGGSIARPAAETLVLVCQNDLWRINSELDKLVAFTNGREITKKDVNDLVRSPYTSDIFGLLDAIGQRRSAAAVTLLHNELQAGTHPLVLISTLANHIRTLLLVGAETPSPMLATKLGLHPFVVKKALEQTKLFSPQTLRDWHHQLVMIDYQLKSTPLDAETLLDVLLLKETAAV